MSVIQATSVEREFSVALECLTLRLDAYMSAQGNRAVGGLEGGDLRCRRNKQNRCMLAVK